MFKHSSAVPAAAGFPSAPVGYIKGVLFCLAATLSWGGMFPVMNEALVRIDPFTFSALRITLAGAAFLALLLVREGRGVLSFDGQSIFMAWFFGTAGFAGFGFLVFYGQQLAGKDCALTASIMMATQPMLALLVTWVIRKSAPPLFSFAFILLSFCGVALVVTKGNIHRLIAEPQNYGADSLIVLGALCWVIYTVGASFYPKWSAVKYTAFTTVLGLTSIYAISGALIAADVVAMPTIQAVVSVAPYLGYMALFAGFIGVLSWNTGNKIITPLNGVLFMDVVPMTTFVISALQGNVPLGVQIAGAGMTCSALILNNWYLRSRASANTPVRIPLHLRKSVSG